MEIPASQIWVPFFMKHPVQASFLRLSVDMGVFAVLGVWITFWRMLVTPGFFAYNK